MNLPPQSSSSEEPTLVPVHQDETPAQQSPVADTPSEETPQQSPVDSTSQDIPTDETIKQAPVDSASDDPIPTPDTPASDIPASDIPASDIPTLPAPSAEPLLEETELPLALPYEPLAEQTELPLTSSYEADETEIPAEEDEEDEEDAFESDLPGSSVVPSSQGGVFISKGWLIGVISAIVVVALLASLLVFVTRPKDPPTDWIATYTPPAGSTTSGKVLYYLHWTNTNGALTGQLQLAANSSGSLQSLTAPASGLYNRDNHIIYVVIIINGQADTLTGKINDTNDTLNLNAAGATDQSSLLVFHIGTASDYKQATKNLVAKKA